MGRDSGSSGCLAVLEAMCGSGECERRVGDAAFSWKLDRRG